MKENINTIDKETPVPIGGGVAMIIIVFIIIDISQILITAVFSVWKVVKILLLVMLAFNVVSAEEAFSDPKLSKYSTYSKYELSCKKSVKRRFSSLFIRGVVSFVFYVTKPGRYFGYRISKI